MGFKSTQSWPEATVLVLVSGIRRSQGRPWQDSSPWPSASETASKCPGSLGGRGVQVKNYCVGLRPAPPLAEARVTQLATASFREFYKCRIWWEFSYGRVWLLNCVETCCNQKDTSFCHRRDFIWSWLSSGLHALGTLNVQFYKFHFGSVAFSHAQKTSKTNWWPTDEHMHPIYLTSLIFLSLMPGEYPITNLLLQHCLVKNPVVAVRIGNHTWGCSCGY